MGRYRFHAVLGPESLTMYGCNIPVQISTSSEFLAEKPGARKSILLMAHLDTGAKLTTIATSIAEYLGLVETGKEPMVTANGDTLNPTYFIDLAFVGAGLAPRKDLKVSSATLKFSFDLHEKDHNDVNNYGILIGRDIMSKWHMTWDGPTSTVIISD